uniref:Phytanoyl-CoA hydroxylase-interacting protein-like C-terminal domain-containing protein n=1 Tax=Meloidogyne javanica TaxID=6303 RepID=A0A915LHQ2_MELJA
MEKHNFLVRMHNLPRNSSLCQILHFIWETVDFEPDEALVRAYSANDAIIGFVNKKFADETVRYCNGRGWYGRIISVSPSNDEELQQIIEESKIAGPDKGPERLGRRKNIEDEIYNDENRNDFDEDNSDFVFGGLDNYSDSAPDTLNFNNSQNPERLPKSKNAGQKSLTMKQSSFGSSRESQRTINNSDKSVDDEIIFEKNTSEIAGPPTKPGKRARRRPRKELRRKSADESALSHQKLTGKRLRLESSSQQPSPLNSANSSFQKVPNPIQPASSDQALNRFPIPSIHTIPVTPGTRYSATIQGFDVEGRQCVISSVHYRAYFSKSELERVMALASRFCGDLMYQFDIVHRCKPRSYFDNIYSQPGGQRMMMPYLKDENGHPGCPINGEIEGCFFSSLLQGDSLPNASPFGDVQMILEVNKILDFKRMNMYFADFYCNQAFAGGQGVSSALHYITVVVCEKNSQTDK